MAAQVSAFGGSTPVFHPTLDTTPNPVLDTTPMNLLAAVKDARGDINEMRILLKGNEETCNRLFKEAVAEGDVITQIQLSHALFGMKWGEDHTKNFSSLTAGDLESFSYYPQEFVLFNSAYDQAMGIKSDGKTHDARGSETFRLAAERGYLPAFLELMHKEWKGNTDSYGFAVQLRPFVGQGDKQLDYYFGQALKNGCQIGSELYYEGMYWMNQSCGIPVKYPKEHQSFYDFKSHYIQYESEHSYYDHNGFRHVGGSVILAPSREAWGTFVKEKLGDVRIAPLNSYMLRHDPEQIKSLLDQYRISVVHTSSFIEHPTKGHKVVDLFGKSKHGFCIDSLWICQDDKEIGKISVQEDTFKIYQTIENPKIKPVIDFIENVMTRSGSAHSAHSWLKQMGGRYIPVPLRTWT